MTDKLRIYRGATRLLGERKIASLTEDRPARYYLDDAWDDDLIDGCLEQGLWNFATRTIEATSDPDFNSPFGLRYRFDKPDDFIRTAGVFTDEYLQCPYFQYTDEAEYWFADMDVLYIQYISNSAGYGNNMAAWPRTFQKFVQATLADEVKELITGNENKYEIIKKALKDSRIDARSKDAMNQPVKFSPTGSWVNARMRGVTTKENGN